MRQQDEIEKALENLYNKAHGYLEGKSDEDDQFLYYIENLIRQSKGE